MSSVWVRPGFCSTGGRSCIQKHLVRQTLAHTIKHAAGRVVPPLCNTKCDLE